MAATDRNTRTAFGRGRTSCGFCRPAGVPAGPCQDTGGHCRGTWPEFVQATLENPRGLWTCACSAGGHPGRPADAPASCAA
jgi:hypothetical protein